MDDGLVAARRSLVPPTARRGLAVHGWIGLGVLAVFLPLNWLLPGARSYWCYTPLWWGLALFVDALCLRGRGTSPLTRSPKQYIGVAIFSIPAWWMFEVLNNAYARDWYFRGGHLFTDFPLGLLGSSALSAVMPVMFGSAEWIASWYIVRRMPRGPILNQPARFAAVLFAGGLLLLGFVVAVSHYSFAFVWLALYLLFEPINYWRGYPTLLRSLLEGDWGPITSLALGGLFAGIFSEFVNWQSDPKWVYDVPWFSFANIFELPLMGYAVFFSVSLELYAAYQLCTGLLGFGETYALSPPTSGPSVDSTCHASDVHDRDLVSSPTDTAPGVF